MYCPPGFIDGEDGDGNVVKGSWRSEVPGGGFSRLRQVGSNRFCRSAAEISETFRDYFMTTEGQVTWQFHHIHRIKH